MFSLLHSTALTGQNQNEIQTFKISQRIAEKVDSITIKNATISRFTSSIVKREVGGH